MEKVHNGKYKGIITDPLSYSFIKPRAPTVHKVNTGETTTLSGVPPETFFCH
jgi:hypothetical protein